MISPELEDGKARQQALNASQSFIVQAPAGSGKTELLTQRYLVLLGCVKQPEEILAITFTKKSAAEMRTRIIKALKNANEQDEPESNHGKQTWQLARKVLERNKTFAWNLLENPNRLQIQTIDSFNASLTRQLPLLSNFGAPLDIADDPESLYREAVQEFLTHLEEDFSWSQAIEKLLIHMDNDLAKVEQLLINMLAKRDQWLPYIATNQKNPALRQTLEKHLGHLVIDCLNQIKACFPLEWIQEVVSLTQLSAQNLLKNHSNLPVTACNELVALPGINLEERKQWLGIISLFLTKNKPFSWRKSFTIAEGFPAPSNAKNADEKKHLTEVKQRLKNLMSELSENDNLHSAFKNFVQLPHHHYEDKQWETLDALHDILRVIVAQLKVIFQQQGRIDYIENAQAAYAALGTDENPTDITLALDYKIQHILIDEFQDTSNSQYRLLNKLIMGWQPGDGRTLFVVGDPMQSIYRFREAEVGLFINARQQGIHSLYLEPLTLSVNFRSTGPIVKWINTHFKKVFPAIEDISTGAVTYSASTPHHNQDDTSQSVRLHPFLNANDKMQADAIVQVIKETQQQHPHQTIAILVRSRTHLKAIIPTLKAANLPFRALKIEPLMSRPVIQDLLALTRALTNLSDKVAWLAILRAPWCGLSLSDLLLISQDPTKQILFEPLQSAEIKSRLSQEGQQSLNRILPILDHALTERRRYSLRQWIELTWLQIGGPASVEQTSDLENAKAYFDLLENLDVASDLVDLTQLNKAINKLYAAPNNQATDSLQIMTIHNAKGLEFDTVILPHLERKASQDDKQLLQWMERSRNNSSELILAPIHAVGEEKNLIYDYVKRQQDQKTDYENGRLLYVAATRAKKQLHVFFNIKSKENDATEVKEPAPNSLLHKLWPAIHEEIHNSFIQKPLSITDNIICEKSPKIKRLSKEWISPLEKSLFKEGSGFHQKQNGFILQQNQAKQMGVVIHQILQQISLHGLHWWQIQSNEFLDGYIKKHLLQLGFFHSNIDASVTTISKAIANTINDTQGKWILTSTREAQCELPLTLIMDGKLKSLVIDKTFVDEYNTRWIIDYKSTEHPQDDLESFLLNQQQRYENQLWEYSQALTELDKRPIKVGLYFPLLPAWREWEWIFNPKTNL